MIYDKDRKLTIEIDNITEAQAIAIEDMFATWQSIGNIGRNRFVGFNVSGEEGFHPEILVNGNPPQQTTLVETKRCWHSIKIKIAPNAANKLPETIWVDEPDVYLVDPVELEEVLINKESEQGKLI